MTGSEDTTARLWKVPEPISGEPEKIKLWAQVITGMEIDEFGAVRLFDNAEWQNRRARLEKPGGHLVK